MLKVLLVSAFPPNRQTAGQDYTRRLVLDLLGYGHEISLIYAAYPGHAVELPLEVEILHVIRTSIRNCIGRLPYHPFYAKRIDDETLHLLRSVADNFDVLYFDFSQVHLYSLYVNHPCKILMCHDVIRQKFKRSGILHLPFIAFAERQTLLSARTVVTFSKKDSNLLKQYYDTDACNVNFYLKSESLSFDNMSIASGTFCFYGAWNRKENYLPLKWFLKKVYPRLNKELSFVIIGGGLRTDIKQLISAMDNVICLGFVEYPILEIARCQALIAPLRNGAGVKVKVIDALSCGTPVIGTDVAFEGITIDPENDLFFSADTVGEYVRIIDNWKNRTVACKQRASAKFRSKYDSNHFPELLEKIVQQGVSTC
ncbi:glycosyltransferase family 4 protein [Treponema brennaborense]|uniref:Glycosyl transferase group 1 n=1 Tax=Treponema brennaborense (strain DSM 12168 / CIP 105900 / DD5/3) TaxID=906968 RepID=F4LIT2_TREBD|nr:glycosyltransferase family 4 protein [Treponema brennaborense]AEE16257.1 glycosyl transferase group 1 [Treponema brennaborense DSM 12168]